MGRGYERRARELPGLSPGGAVWLAYRTAYSASWSEMVPGLRGDGQLEEISRPVSWTVALGVETVLALVMALGALPPALRTASSRRDEPESATAEA